VQKIAYYTDHFVNQTVMQFFSKSLGIELLPISKFNYEDKILCTYGILRGTAEAIKSSKEYIYIDHGFFNSSLRSFTENNHTILRGLDGYFRVIGNDLYFNKDYYLKDNKRFKKLNIELKDLNKNGEYIILSEPTENTLKYLGISDWTNNTLNKLQKITDRKIVVHNKFSEIALDDLLKNAYAFVSLQSTAGFKAIIEGVPAYFTHESLNNYGDIMQIDNRNLNHELLYLAANSQWKLNEFFDDEFKEYSNNIVS